MKIFFWLALIISTNTFSLEISLPVADKSIFLLLGQKYSQMSEAEKENVQKQLISLANNYNQEEVVDVKQKLSSLNEMINSSEVYFEKNNCKDFFNGYARASLEKKSLKTKLICKNTSINSIKSLKQLEVSANEFYGGLLKELSDQYGDHEMIKDLKLKIKKIAVLEKLLKKHNFSEAKFLLTELKNLVEV